jgi:hypothetical protein
MLTATEVEAGLVLHLDPDVLEQRGGTYTCGSDLRVQEGHFFVCLSVSGGAGVWLPLYSKSGVGRQPLAATGRSGHAKWTKGTFFWHTDQVWTAPHDAVVAAAKAGGDMSRSGSRNLLAPQALPRLK